MATPDGESAERRQDMQLLVAQYREDAFRLARHLVRSQADAEDLAHTAIVSVLRRAENISDAAASVGFQFNSLSRSQLGNQKYRHGRVVKVSETFVLGHPVEPKQNLQNKRATCRADRLGT